jgi:orotate phosphoribosyltransferase
MTISLAAEIYKRAHLEGRFRLRSGASSTEYFDKYRFESDPLLLRQIAEQLCDLLPTDAEALAGLELGGIPIATNHVPAVGPTSAVRPQRTKVLRHPPAC